MYIQVCLYASVFNASQLIFFLIRRSFFILKIFVFFLYIIIDILFALACALSASASYYAVVLQ